MTEEIFLPERKNTFRGEISTYRIYLIAAAGILILIYSLPFILNHDRIVNLGREDAFVETLTALTFFAVATVFTVLFIKALV